MLLKTATSLVGLGTEVYAHHKQKKQEQNNISASTAEHLPTTPEAVTPDRRRSATPNGSDTSSIYGLDEDEWTRDEAQDQLTTTDTTENMEGANVDQLKQDLAPQHRPPSHEAVISSRLPHPVVIPQKRPESKTHGFVRAYAPVLNDCGIDQIMFLEFLRNFTKSMKGEGYFNVVNLAIAASVITYTAAAATVNPAVHLAALAVHTSIEAGKRVRNTHQINMYMERMNEELFKPHGLYAMLMTWKPDSDETTVPIDINGNILKSVFARSGGDRSKFHSASGQTIGDAQMPESAALVFPAFEAADPEQKKNALKRAVAFVNDYHDRRARAQFQHNNPDSTLNTGSQERFASIFSDPNHPINKGGSLNVLSGGYLYRGAAKLRHQGAGSVIPFRVDRQAGKAGTGVGGSSGRTVKRLLGKNVLYLMVVNMPTEEELMQAALLYKKTER